MYANDSESDEAEKRILQTSYSRIYEVESDLSSADETEQNRNIVAVKKIPEKTHSLSSPQNGIFIIYLYEIEYC